MNNANKCVSFLERLCKLLTITIIITFLIMGVFVATISPVQAEQTNQDKGLSILSNVVGLDIGRYEVNSQEFMQNKSDWDPFQPKSASFILTSNQGNLKISCTFTNGNLQMIQVLENNGIPNLNEEANGANSVEQASSFLSNYQTQTADSLFGELNATLANVDENKNLTKTIGNTFMEVSSANSYSTFKWTYILNGVIAPDKFVSLGFKDNFLAYFVDNWNIYEIASTKISVAENSAKTTAMDNAKTHNWSLPLENNIFDASNFNQSNVLWMDLIFENSVGAKNIRSNNASMLYPVWRVGIALDKWYGNLYGIQVDIWADTGEIRLVQEAWSSITPEEENALANSSTINATSSPTFESTSDYTNCNEESLDVAMQPNILVLLLTLIVTCTGVLWTVKKKSNIYWVKKIRLHRKINTKSQLHFCRVLRRKNPKSAGIMLLGILLMSSTMFFSFIPSVKATPTAGAVVWGSESIGSFDPSLTPEPTSWRKSNDEVDCQQYIAPTIRYLFSQSGYSPAWNHQGESGSYKTGDPGILLDIQNLMSYDRVAVVDFDHGIGQAPGYDYYPENEWHFQFEDQAGTLTGWYNNETHPIESHPENGVYDNDIYGLVGAGKVVFAFINTCLSASLDDWDPNDPPFGQGLWPPQQYPPIPQRAFGMPFAWTHGREVKPIDTQGFNIGGMMSDDGYSKPDWGDQVYIGFRWGSASLSQNIPFTGGTKTYGYWVEQFFSAALNSQFPETVNQALDSASLRTWGTYFGMSYLHNGFDAYWWMQDPADPYEDSTMAIYGNGDIYILNPSPQPSEVGSWQYDEGAGSTAYDSSSYSNHGTVYGASWVSGQYDYALDFDGVNDYVEVPSSSGLAGFNQAFTVHAWINMDNATRRQSIIQKYNTAGNQRAWMVEYNSNSLWLFASPDGTNYDYWSASFNPSAGTWYHIAVVWKANQVPTFYINGQPQTTIRSGTISSIYSNTAPLHVARCTYDSSRYFDGKIDKVHIFSRALSDQEIADAATPSPPPTFYDDFDDGNYDGWTYTSGNWTVDNGKLRGQTSYAPIYTNTNFPSDRTVQSQLQTTTAGEAAYDVAVLMIKWVNIQNQITTRLFTDGTVELITHLNGNTVQQWQVSSTLSPSDPHVFRASVEGTKIKIWIDGVLYINENNNYFDDISGAVGYQSSPDSYFDNMAVYIPVGSATVFQDDFESGSTNAWDSQTVSSGETASASSQQAYQGTYSLQSASNGDGGYEYARLNKAIDAQSEIYVRGYFKISQNGIVDNSDRIKLIELRAGTTIIAAAGLWRASGTTRWWMETRDGTSWVETYPSQGQVSIDLSQWFSLELKWNNDASAGGGTLWVNGSQIYSINDADTDDYGNCTAFNVGMNLVNCASTTAYVDNVIAATSYIGT